jgi:hypothetical protein
LSFFIVVGFLTAKAQRRRKGRGGLYSFFSFRVKVADEGRVLKAQVVQEPGDFCLAGFVYGHVALVKETDFEQDNGGRSGSVKQNVFDDAQGADVAFAWVLVIAGGYMSAVAQSEQLRYAAYHLACNMACALSGIGMYEYFGAGGGGVVVVEVDVNNKIALRNVLTYPIDNLGKRKTFIVGFDAQPAVYVYHFALQGGGVVVLCKSVVGNGTGAGGTVSGYQVYHMQSFGGE